MFSTFSGIVSTLRGSLQRVSLAQATLRPLSTESATSGQALLRPAAVDDQPDQLFSKLELELKGSDPAVLKSYAQFASTAAEHLSIEVGKSWALRKAVHNRFVLLKSVHIYKKHRVHYEIRTHYRFINLHRLTGSTLATYLEYIERNLPEGVAMKATKVERLALPEHLQKPPAQPEIVQ